MLPGSGCKHESALNVVTGQRATTTTTNSRLDESDGIVVYDTYACAGGDFCVYASDLCWSHRS